MALPDLGVLAKYKAAPFAPGYPLTALRFYAPVDQVHAVLMELVQSAAKSLVVAMFGYDDPDLAAAIKAKMADPGVFVQLTLDSSQAGGVHEKLLLAQEAYPATSIAIGQSEHGAIMHMKLLIIDGLDVVDGSTNWSGGAEVKQDNQLTVTRDPYVAAEARARVDAIHVNMLAKAGKTLAAPVAVTGAASLRLLT